MNKKNSDIIKALCSSLSVGSDVKPLSTKEWSEFSKKLIELNSYPFEILDFTEEDFKEKLLLSNDMINRIRRLLSRSASLTFEIEKLSRQGIEIITRADKEYPKKLKNKLGQASPPLFYYSGNLNILNNKCAGFVGSRSVEEKDTQVAEKKVLEMIKKNMTVVSGGAKGIDSVSIKKALSLGGNAIEFISDSMLKKIKKTDSINAIRKGKLLIISFVKPDMHFLVGNAMARNKYIYSQCEEVYVIKSDFKKGGTWAGALENFNKKYTKECSEQLSLFSDNKVSKGKEPIFNFAKLYCWDNKKYKGNQELIKKGAVPFL